jgi:SAM-dependent methyltransferase
MGDRMTTSSAIPLDLEHTSYSYIERSNRVILDLLDKHVLGRTATARVLDVGCGCGANAQALRKAHPGAWVTGIEPNDRAFELAGQACSEIFHGTLEGWLSASPNGAREPYDAVVLSDVLEHIVDPIAFLNHMREVPALAHAKWVISVPNYGVWYNRLRTLAGRFEYSWSGLYDRTHVRFYTRKSIKDLLAYCGLSVIDDRCTPSLVQSTAPWLRALFQKKVEKGEHLALTESPLYRAYERAIEPGETAVCQLWPELLGFQIVSVAERA